MRSKFVIASGAALVVVVVAALVLMWFKTSEQVDSWSKEPQQEEQQSFKNVEAKDAPANEWMKKFLNSQPEGYALQVHEESKELNLHVANCAYVNEVRTSDKLIALGDASAEGKQPTVVAAAFQSGYGSSEYNEYLKKLNNCSIDYKEGEANSVKYASFANGAILTAGDTVVSVSADSNEERDALIEFYSKSLSDTLVSTSCLNLIYSSDDYTRNVYQNTYKEFQKNTSVNTKVSVDDLSSVTFSTSVLPEHHKVEKPEGPYPKDFPVDLPSFPGGKPTLEAKPQNFQQSSTFLVPAVDVTGPGCGWAWSGLKKPVFDESDVASRAKAEIAKKQSELDTSNLKSKKELATYNINSLKRTALVAQWNEYVAKSADVYSKWSELNAARTALRPLWEQYIQSTKDYVSKVNEYNKTVDEYFSKFVDCYTEELKKDNKAREKDIQPTCSAKVGVLPEFTEQAPAAPQFDATAVTLPTTWEQPQSVPEIKQFKSGEAYSKAQSALSDTAQSTPTASSTPSSRS